MAPEAGLAPFFSPTSAGRRRLGRAAAGESRAPPGLTRCETLESSLSAFAYNRRLHYSTQISVCYTCSALKSFRSILEPPFLTFYTVSTLLHSRSKVSNLAESGMRFIELKISVLLGKSCAGPGHSEFLFLFLSRFLMSWLSTSGGPRKI
jgi:hypothetical protein